MPDVTVKAIEEMEPIYGGLARRARAELGVSAWGMQVFTLPPEWDGYPTHNHGADAFDPNQEEVYIPLSGAATLVADGSEFELRPGMMARVGPDQLRRILPGPEGIPWGSQIRSCCKSRRSTRPTELRTLRGLRQLRTTPDPLDRAGLRGGRVRPGRALPRRRGPARGSSATGTSSSWARARCSSPIPRCTARHTRGRLRRRSSSSAVSPAGRTSPPLGHATRASSGRSRADFTSS